MHPVRLVLLAPLALALACAEPGADPITAELPGDAGIVATSFTIGPRIDDRADLGCEPIVATTEIDVFLAEHPASYVADVDGAHLLETGRIDFFDASDGCHRECLVACTGRWACSTTHCGPVETDPMWYRELHWRGPDDHLWLPPDPESSDPAGPADGVPSVPSTDPSGDGSSGGSSGGGGSGDGSSDGSSGSSGSGGYDSPDPGGRPW